MKRIILVYGIISGLIVGSIMAFTIPLTHDENFNMETSMVLGYASMLLAFSMIFIGIKSFRDKEQGGIINFGKAFKVGFFICLISSTIYVIVWMVMYYNFMPDFMEKYQDMELQKARESGATEAEMQKKIEQMEFYSNLYKTPIGVIFMTYFEILPLGTIISLIAAAILKRKQVQAAA